MNNKFVVSMFQGDFNNWMDMYHRYLDDREEVRRIEKNEVYFYPDEVDSEAQTYSLYLGHLMWVLDPNRPERDKDEDGNYKLPCMKEHRKWTYRWATEEEAERYMIERITYQGG
jgi:hypothetical protein